MWEQLLEIGKQNLKLFGNSLRVTASKGQSRLKLQNPAGYFLPARPTSPVLVCIDREEGKEGSEMGKPSVLAFPGHSPDTAQRGKAVEIPQLL